MNQGGALNDPLGLTITRDHHLIAAKGNDDKLVEVNALNGKQVAVKLFDNTGGSPPGAGALLGLTAVRDGVYFVDDASNTFNLIIRPSERTIQYVTHGVSAAQ